MGCFVEGDLIDGETPTDSEVIVNVETPANWPSQGGTWFLCTIFYIIGLHGAKGSCSRCLVDL